MCAKKSNVAVVVGASPTIDLHQTPIAWNVKYKEEHLLPCEVTQGRMNRLLRCVGGEVVYLRWCGTFRNECGESQSQLDDTCQRLYSWAFARVRSNWIARLEKVDDWWDLVELVKVEKCEK